MLNGVVLIAAERRRRRFGSANSTYVDERISGPISDAHIAAMPVRKAVLVGTTQCFALAPGIFRSGITMVAGVGDPGWLRVPCGFLPDSESAPTIANGRGRVGLRVGNKGVLAQIP